MTQIIRRGAALLLTLALFISLFPAVMAAETEETASPLVSDEAVLETQVEMQTTEPEITEPPTESPPGETIPEETTAPDTEATVPSETTPEASSEMDIPMNLPEDADMLSVGSTQGSIMLFDYADNGNYTTVLNSQVSCTYKPNGSGITRTAYIKNLGWHFARYGGVAYPDDPLYCIEPWRNYGASTSGNTVDQDVTLSGSGSTSGSNVWYAMPTARREVIGLILLYSDQMWDHSVSVTTTRKDSNPNVPLRIATQFLIYEIVCGMRDPSTFERNYENECGTSGDVFYNAGKASVSGFSSNYNTLVSNIQAAKKIPSFTSSSMGNAPTITLNGTSTSVTDTNGVLSYFSFPNGSGASFSKSGSTLKITQTGTISESTAFKATRYLPSASSSTYNLWYMSGSSYQTTISLCNASNGNLNAYFKLKAPSLAGLALTKTTEDGKNLSGWQFGIYSNSACTSLVSGPHTTDSSGKISVTGLSARTYYVKELGHTDSAINALYTCSSTNPQKITLTAGQTASVSFHNVLAMGRIEFRKTTNTGNHLGGWTFRVKDSSGNVVGDYTTDETGYAITEDLPLGRYLVMELPTGDNYWVTELGYHDVTVTAGKTVVDTWMNKEQGLGWFYKETNTGESLEGWKITIYSDEACTKEVRNVITNDEGKIGHYFDPGIYWARETGDEYGRFQDSYWQIDDSIQQFEIRPHEDTTVAFTNTYMGKLKIIKTVEGDGSVEGWQFKITDADSKVLDGSPFTTDKNGIILSGNLLPGKYTIEEILPEDSLYQCNSENPQTVTITPGETVEVSFVNTLRPGKIAVQKVDITGKPLAGATFLLEWSEDGTSWEPVTYSDADYPVKGGCSNPDLKAGCLPSGEDGLLEWNNLHPSLHYRLSETKAPDGYALLKKPAFTGQLPEDDLTIEMRVVNARIFTMPDTGANDLFLLPTLGYLILSALILLLGRKRKEVI